MLNRLPLEVSGSLPHSFDCDPTSAMYFNNNKCIANDRKNYSIYCLSKKIFEFSIFSSFSDTESVYDAINNGSDLKRKPCRLHPILYLNWTRLIQM